MPAFKSAESVLRELGISKPEDIDIEAIAYHCGAIVRYRSLDDCAARIIGHGDKAVISVDKNERRRGRQRFSIAHEIGHWMQDRGKALFCQTDDFQQNWGEQKTLGPEAMANKYAADLLMPSFLFKPAAKNKDITFESVNTLAELFETSATATALKLVWLGAYPSMLVCYNQRGRCWFKRGPDVPSELWPSRELPHQTHAFELLFGDTEYGKPVTADASDWIEHQSSYNYIIVEHGIKITKDTILVLLWWKDESQLLDL